MNAPFKPDLIMPILAEVGVSISDLKKNPAAVVKAARDQQIAILNRNMPVAYVISPDVWAHICEMIEDQADAALARDRLDDPQPRLKVEIADLV
jgi:antitoxin StbD